MNNPTGIRLKFCHAALLGTTALVCLSVVEPVFAEDFIITGNQTTTNGGEGPINGNDSVTLNGTITTTTGYGISTTGGSNKISIETGGVEATSDGKPVRMLFTMTGGSYCNHHWLRLVPLLTPLALVRMVTVLY